MFDFGNAVSAGLAGGLAMSLTMFAARATRLVEADLERYQGCMIRGRDEGAGTRAAGMALHLTISVLVALLYAWAFARFWGDATWSLGLILAVVHGLVGGFVLPIMDGMNRCVREGGIRPFGIFGSKHGGTMVVGFLMGHLSFGATVGWLYVVPGL